MPAQFETVQGARGGGVEVGRLGNSYSLALAGRVVGRRGAINIMFLHISVVETRLLTAYGT